MAFTIKALSAIPLLVLFYIEEYKPAERLHTGIVVVRQDQRSAYIYSRLLKEDPANVGFNVYRSTGRGKPTNLNQVVLTTVTWFVDDGPDFTKINEWFVRPVVNGKELKDSE